MQNNSILSLIFRYFLRNIRKLELFIFLLLHYPSRLLCHFRIPARAKKLDHPFEVVIGRGILFARLGVRQRLGQLFLAVLEHAKSFTRELLLLELNALLLARLDPLDELDERHPELFVEEFRAQLLHTPRQAMQQA